MAIEQLVTTDCVAGTGWDPNFGRGYQTAAVSPGLAGDDPEAKQRRTLLTSIHAQYGNLVSEVDPAAVQAQQQTRGAGHDANRLPDDVLALFPVVYTYHDLGDDWFAFSRISYLGYSTDGRLGNFLAHALVFQPDELEPFDYNPLALAEAERFLRLDELSGTSLPALETLGTGPGAAVDFPALVAGPLGGRLDQLVTALETASARPVVLGLEPATTEPTLRAVLALLPAQTRARTTSSTLVTDCGYVPTAGGRRPEGLVSAYHLMALPGMDPPRCRLRADEVKAVYSVFNPVGDQFSDAAEPTAYATLLARCVQTDDLEPLDRLLLLLDRLELGRDPVAWSALVPAAALQGDQPDGLPAAAAALGATIRTPSAAATALRLLRPHLAALATSPDVAAALATLAAVAPATGRLLELSEAAETHLQELVTLVAAALAAGRARLAESLARTCGVRGEQVLLQAAEQASTGGPVWPAEQPEDAEALLDLLARVLELAAGRPALVDPLLGTAFASAAAHGLAEAAWARLGERLVVPRLGGDWDQPTRALADSLALALTPAVCPAGCYVVVGRLLEQAAGGGDQRLDWLAELLLAAAGLPSAARVVPPALDRVEAEFDGPARIEAYGVLAERVAGTAMAETVYQRYCEQQAASAAAEEEPQTVWSVRRKLAARQAYGVLCRELWDEALTGGACDLNVPRDWFHRLGEQRAGLAQALAQQLTAELQCGAPVSPGVWDLAFGLLPSAAEGATVSDAQRQLYAALVLALPLQRLSDQRQARLRPIPAGVPELVTERLALLDWLGAVRQAAACPEWSLTAFPRGDHAWCETAKELDAGRREELLVWLVEILSLVGLEQPADVGELHRVLGSAGYREPREFATVLQRLGDSRDTVTRVSLAALVLRQAYETQAASPWAPRAKLLVEVLPKPELKLLVDYLQQRCRRRDPAAEARLQQLLVELQLVRPAPTARPTGAGPAAEPAESAPEKAERGILNRAMRWLRGSDSEPPERG